MDKLIELQATDTAQTAVDKLDPKPDSIILLLGTPGKDVSKLRDILSHSLVPAAVDANALVIVGESKAGESLFPVFSEVVKGVDVARTIGMRLPAERGILSPFQIAAQLGKAPKGAGRLAATILLGGAERDIPTLLDCTKQEWPSSSFRAVRAWPIVFST